MIDRILVNNGNWCSKTDAGLQTNICINMQRKSMQFDDVLLLQKYWWSTAVKTTSIQLDCIILAISNESVRRLRYPYSLSFISALNNDKQTFDTTKE